MLERGTRTRSATDIAAEIQAIGGVLKGFAAPGTLGLRVHFLPNTSAAAWRCSRTAWRARRSRSKSSVPPIGRSLARARDDARAGDVTARAALRLFGETLSPETVRRDSTNAPSTLGRFALLNRYRRRYPLSRLVVAVVGNVNPAAVAALLTNGFPASASPVPTSSSSPSFRFSSPCPPRSAERAREGGAPSAAPAMPASPAEG